MRTIDTSITIDAAPERVWEVLVDFAGYPDWNPFIVRGQGAAEVGSRLSLDIQPPGERLRRHGPMVLLAEPARHLQWRGNRGFPGLYAVWHEFVLEPDGAATVLRQREFAAGLFAPLRRARGARTAAGCEAMNGALKQRVEHANRRPG